MPAVAGSLGDVRAEVERVAQDPDITTPERALLLSELRDQVTDLLGHIDEYAADVEKLASAPGASVDEALTFVRSNADIREELLRRGLADPATLDEANYLPHDELDRLAEEGLLESAAVELHRKYLDILHPRDRHGEWIDKPGIPERHDLVNRPSTASLQNRWASLDRELLPFAGNPSAPEAKDIIRKQQIITKLIHHSDEDRGGPEGVGKPGGARDVTVIGAGPAGLSAAIYGGTEGMDTLMLDSNDEPGGQAQMSSRIENVLGFPAGITGKQYAGMSLEQAQRVGATTEFGVHVTGLDYDKDTGMKHVQLSDGRVIDSRTVVIAGGVQFRKLGFEGADAKGIVYGSSAEMKSHCDGKPAVIVGGANSAGQAAIDVASVALHVTVLVRKGKIEDKMSDYLVKQLRDDPKITILEGAEIKAAHEDESGHVTGVTLTNGKELACDAVGLFIGSKPETDWAGVERDSQGYIKVGGEGKSELETSIPGVYAAGDVRAGTVHRVIMAAADGAHAISLAWPAARNVKASVQEAAEDDWNDESLRKLADSIPNDAADDWFEELVGLDADDPMTGAEETDATR